MAIKDIRDPIAKKTSNSYYGCDDVNVNNKVSYSDKPAGKLATPMKDSGSNDIAKANEFLYAGGKKKGTTGSNMTTKGSGGNDVAKKVNKTQSPGRTMKADSNATATKVNKKAGKGF